MTPAELREAGLKVFGEHGWQTRMAEALEVDGSSVRRWVSGAVPVPGPVAAAMRCFVHQKSVKRARDLRVRRKPK